MISRNFISIAVLFLLSVGVVPAQDTFESGDFWYDILLGGQKIGYVHESVKPDGPDGSYRMSSLSFMRILRGGTKMVFYQKDIYYVSESGEIQEFEITDSSPDGSGSIYGEVEDGVLHLKILRDGEVEEMALDPPADWYHSVAVLQDMMSEGLFVGQHRQYSRFDADERIFRPVDAEIIGKLDEPASFKFRILDGDIELYEYVDLEGELLKIEAGGLAFERTTESGALAKFETEMLFNTAIRVDTLIPRPELVSSMAIQCTADNVDLRTLFPNDRRQILRPLGAEEGVLMVSTASLSGKSASLPYKRTKDLAPYLTATENIEASHPNIRAIARQIAGEETDSLRLAQKIYEWVTENIGYSYEVLYGSATDTLNNRIGDCTEFATLYAALARSAGIPTKMCFGLVYTPVMGFLFHAWNEVYVGEWIAIDTAMNQLSVDATHLKIGEYGDDDTANVSQQILNVIGQLELEILKFETREPPVQLTEAAIVRDGEYYRDPEYNIGVIPPAGWQLSTDPITEGNLITLVNADLSKSNISVAINPWDREQPLDEYLDLLTYYLENSGYAYEADRMEVITFRGQPAAIHDYTLSVSGITVKGSQLAFVLSDEELLLITVTTLKEHLSAAQAAWQFVLDNLDY